MGEPAQRGALVNGVLDGDGQQQQAVNVAQIELLTSHLQWRSRLTMRSCSQLLSNNVTWQASAAPACAVHLWVGIQCRMTWTSSVVRSHDICALDDRSSVSW